MSNNFNIHIKFYFSISKYFKRYQIIIQYIIIKINMYRRDQRNVLQDYIINANS